MATKDDENKDQNTEDDRFEERFNMLFHKASIEREKRFKKDLMKEFDSTLGPKFEELREALKASVTEKANPEAKQGEPGQPPAKLSAEAEALLRQAQKDAKDAKDMADKWRKDAEAERARGRAAEERQQLTTLLTGRVKPSVLEMVVDQLHGKNIVRDEDSGTILWKDHDGATLPLKDGVSAWAKSDLGKEFAPPVPVKGTGSRGPGDGGANGVRPGDMTLDILGSIVEGSMGGSRQ